MAKRLLCAVIMCLAMAGCGKDSPLEPVKKANVVMIEGPIFVDDGNSFRYQGRVQNKGDATAKFAKLYVYLRRSDNSLLEQAYTNLGNLSSFFSLAPAETAPWAIPFGDADHAIRDAMDRSKTTYEIKWD